MDLDTRHHSRAAVPQFVRREGGDSSFLIGTDLVRERTGLEMKDDNLLRLARRMAVGSSRSVAIKSGRYSMVDWYGTPHTEALHVIERYRLLDHEAAKDGFARDAKEHNVAQGMRNANHRGKYPAAPIHGRG
jgi:hypothetical protein